MPEDIGTEYDYNFIRNNPIQSVCTHCKAKEPINAPRIENCRCFWCGGNLIPTDIKAYRERVANLWRYVVPVQIDLFTLTPERI